MNRAGIGWWLDQVGRVPLLTPTQEIELGGRVQAWLCHPDGPQAAPPKVRRSGAKAREQFVAANLRLAVSYVTKHCGRLVRLGYQDDLVQAANLGVIRAVEKFDPTRGYRFSTYAYWWIRQSVNRWIDQHTRMVSMPGSHAQILSRVETSRRRLLAQLAREPTREELAAEVGISVPFLDDLLARARSHLSLDQSADEDGGDLGLFVGRDDPDPADLEERAATSTRVEELLGGLTPQQRRVVRMRHGLDGPPLSAAEVARSERISSRAVERILREALTAMGRSAKAPRSTAPPPDPERTEAIGQLTLFPGPGGSLEPLGGGARRRRRSTPRGTPAPRRAGRTGPADAA